LCAITDIPDAGAIECELHGESLVVLRYGQDVQAVSRAIFGALRAVTARCGQWFVSL
jgi:hypothetical protein